ncbi:spore-associated protein A [Streptomyces sp. Ru73]|uniref:spore-associated protein A n=1 Tax=Streptomyces sp. Ru73 TaxID=2080748 RepID=UPI0021563869|nr:spore-associated protein A [Streptomyces sp. Ru73]
MTLIRRAATTAALTAVTVGAVTALASPSSAAPRTTATAAAAPATAQAAYNGVCGSGYKVIDSTPVSDVGTVYVTWNESTGKNCAVTIRNTPGTPAVWMAVSLAIDAGRGAPYVVDSGHYTTYAGPVYLDARGQCILWNAAIDGVGANGRGHCG